MNTFKRKALTCAVLAGLGAVATTAEAVVRNPDNTGMVLIYPYYTVQSAGGNLYNTYVSVTNTTTRAKVLKVRFREGKTSAEVLDFNVYLSPNDMWVGALRPDGTGVNDPARIVSGGDLSCTDPPIPAAGEPFKNFAMTGADALPGTTLDRTREGYVEIFEMANLTGTAAANVTHPATVGAAPACPNSIMSYIDPSVTPSGLVGNLEAPSGGLYGNATLINVSNGSDFGYTADALDQYQVAQYYATVGSVLPQLGASAAPPSSLVLANGTAYSQDFTASPSLGTAGARAVASVYMHSSVMNDYILDTATGSNTDWVMTFPVKREFVNATTAGSPFTAVMTSTGACEPALFNIFNRDEQSQPLQPGGFSPPPSAATPGTGTLCWESTVVSVRNGLAHTIPPGDSSTQRISGVLGSRNTLAVTVPQNFQNGWMMVTFTGAGATSAAGGVPTFGVGNRLTQTAGSFTAVAGTFVGLPVTGFMVRTLTNNAVDCVRGGVTVAGGCQGNYSALFPHAYRTTVR
jgi:hypothetical protein